MSFYFFVENKFITAGFAIWYRDIQNLENAAPIAMPIIKSIMIPIDVDKSIYTTESIGMHLI